jgi:hypothetical protein
VAAWEAKATISVWPPAGWAVEWKQDTDPLTRRSVTALCLVPPHPIVLSRLRAKLSRSEVPLDLLADCTNAVLPVMCCDFLMYQSTLGKYVFKPGALWFQARTPQLERMLSELRDKPDGRSLFLAEWAHFVRLCESV